MPYEPSQQDIEWASRVLAAISNGGILVYPSTGLVYKVDHDRQVITLTNTDRLNYFESFVVHEQTKEVLAVIGWGVEDHL